MTRYDPAQAIPFIDITNRYAQVGSLFSPGVLAAQTWWHIAVGLHHRSSAIAHSVDGAANYLTAAICALTGNRPRTDRLHSRDPRSGTPPAAIRLSSDVQSRA
jgi:hypothetical protein